MALRRLKLIEGIGALHQFVQLVLLIALFLTFNLLDAGSLFFIDLF